jgi:hypothetical protein
MRVHRDALFGILLAVVMPCLAYAEVDWQPCVDNDLHVAFRHPKDWKTSPSYSDRTYFGGPDGSVQLIASEGDDPLLVCRGQATHHLQPFGSHPRIRRMRVQGQRACLVWPSQEQGTNADALLTVEFPRPVEDKLGRWTQLMLFADKNHIREIARTLQFISPTIH